MPRNSYFFLQKSNKSCVIGSETVNYAWSAWGDYSDCTVQCGGDGTQERFRSCIPPVKGGYPCPSQMQSSTQSCNNGPCPSKSKI